MASSSAGHLTKIGSPHITSTHIECAATLFRDVKMESSSGNVRGVLYGVRDPGVLRVVAARRDLDDKDPCLAGLETIGFYTTRARGEVFLTESDLDRLQRLGSATVALVIAGRQVRFFVREPGGAIKSIRGKQGVRAERVNTAAKSGPLETRRSVWIALAATALATIPLLTGSHLHLSSQPPDLTVRENAGQLRIAWTGAVIAGPATLEIDDGPENRSIFVPSNLTNITYARRSGDVLVRLISNDRQESAHFVGSEPVTVEEMTEAVRERITDLEKQAKSLRASLAFGQQRIAQLETRLSTK